MERVTNDFYRRARLASSRQERGRERLSLSLRSWFKGAGDTYSYDGMGLRGDFARRLSGKCWKEAVHTRALKEIWRLFSVKLLWWLLCRRACLLYMWVSASICWVPDILLSEFWCCFSRAIIDGNINDLSMNLAFNRILWKLLILKKDLQIFRVDSISMFLKARLGYMTSKCWIPKNLVLSF